MIQVIRVEGTNVFDIGFTQLQHRVFGDLVVGLGHDLTRFRVDHVHGNGAAEDKVLWHRDALHVGFFEIANVLGGDALVLRDEYGAALVDDIEASHLAFEALRHQFHLSAFAHQLEIIKDKEMRQDLLGVQANGLEQNRDRHLATTVHAEIQNVFRVKFIVEPRAAIRNNPCREQQLAGAMGLAAVMLKEHAG